jgi:hypothetical protein
MNHGTTARHAERGQTLPIWTLAVLTALTLMFFSLNYANTIRWQVRAQNAADSMATAALSVQATQWNKMMMILYTADVEEWRIRHLIEGMYVAQNESGGCVPYTNGVGSCLRIYNALQTQYYKAVNRYTKDVQMMQAFSTPGASSQQADATTVMQKGKASCSGPTPVVDCSFTYHLIDYGHRTTTMLAGKDAFFMKIGPFTTVDPSAVLTPVADWEPAQMEIATCATVQPIVNFSFFGQPPQAKHVIGRAAASNVMVVAEWLAPGVTTNPATGNVFQPEENYDLADDTFAAAQTPRDWYETDYPSIDFTAYPNQTLPGYSAIAGADFQVRPTWWATIPLAPYITASQDEATLCTQT